MQLTDEDFRQWSAALRALPADAAEIVPWSRSHLRHFLPFERLLMVYGECIAGEIRMTDVLSIDHDPAYLAQVGRIFDIHERGSLSWWFLHRQPLFIDPSHPPSHVSRFELDELHAFGLGRIAAHGVLNLKSNAGTYFSFSGLSHRSAQWHLHALRLVAPILNDLYLRHLASTSVVAQLLATLTPRQREVVRQLAQGKDDKTIARAMDISEKTVRNQLTQIYAKLGISKRTQLMLALR